MLYGDDEVLAYISRTYGLNELVKLLEEEGVLTMDDFLETYEEEILELRSLFEKEMREEDDEDFDYEEDD